MLYFDSDYMAGAHPYVMARLNDTNLLHTTGYGTDPFTAEAKTLILHECGLERGEVFFLVGGTQTNMVVIDRLLSRNDGVLAAASAHINVHEAGAIESCGHKVITLPGDQGKLRAGDIRDYIEEFYRDDTYIHMVRPAMVYISFPTELGTIYSRRELNDIHDVCREYDIPLFIDGARMAYGLAASRDLTLGEIASLCDVFYIGGTKCGAMFGEAVVTRRPELFKRFASLTKLHGAMLAKGRLLGVQFKALFENGLYYEIGENAVRLANKIKEGFLAKGYKMFIDSPSNQQFFVMPNQKISELRKYASFELWGAIQSEETPVRFVTDWTTTEADINELLSHI